MEILAAPIYDGHMASGETIKALRKRAKLTQATLAARLEVTPQSISNWERGADEPSGAHILALADALAVSVEELYRRKVSLLAAPAGPPDLESLKSLLRPAFELRGLSADQARDLVEALIEESRTPPGRSGGVSDAAEMRIRAETLLRAYGRK